MTNHTVTSKDGTGIAYERTGAGPAVVLVGGGLSDRSENTPLVPALTDCFTVVNYDRRGRGASDDAEDYNVAREVEDIDALIAATGGTAHLYGVSSGGALALEAALAGSAVGKLAVYDVPYNRAPDWPEAWTSYTDELDRALAAGDRGAALEAFLRVTGTPKEDIAGMRSAPFWPNLEAIAHTLRYDAACLGTGQPPVDRLATIRQPVLVLTSDERSPHSARWVLALDDAADAIASAIPGAERDTLLGQGHVADPDAVAARLGEFFDARTLSD
jgi:pimeloyl-ACP methyl ester carboxylesterase